MGVRNREKMIEKMIEKERERERARERESKRGKGEKSVGWCGGGEIA